MEAGKFMKENSPGGGGWKKHGLICIELGTYPYIRVYNISYTSYDPVKQRSTLLTSTHEG